MACCLRPSVFVGSEWVQLSCCSSPNIIPPQVKSRKRRIIMESGVLMGFKLSPKAKTVIKAAVEHQVYRPRQSVTRSRWNLHAKPPVDFSATSCHVEEAGQVKIRVEVSGSTTQTIFDQVFDKMVADAQPIPGFRRVKGGKTPDIPKHILLELLGPSKVLRRVIRKLINSTISDHVRKEGFKVSKDLRVEQSFEDLELSFEAGKTFTFDALLHLQQTN